MDKEAALAKARALLAKAEATQFEAEANTYNARAMEILVKYGIDVAEAYAEDNGSDTVINLYIDIAMPYAKEKIGLLDAVAKLMASKLVLITKRAPHRVHLFGFESDIERVQMMYTSLLIQAFRLLDEEIRLNGIPPYDRRGAYQRAWLAGYTSRVYRRLKAILDRANNAVVSTGTDLVLRDRALAVKEQFEQAHPSVKVKTRTLRGSGYHDGFAAGARADLGQTRVGTERKAIS